MNYLILNREFQMASDGWYQIAALGEFPHALAGVVQVVDQAACEAMVNAFHQAAGADHFAGLLVDFDHFSLDSANKSEAAGWITAVEARGAGPGGGGLWANIRWSDLGEQAVKGGRYRFISPVWARSDCEDLGPDPQSGRDRVRPMRLLNAAVTNDPNLKGMVPLSNRGQRSDVGGQMSEIIGQAAPVSNTVRTDMARAAALAVRQAKAGLRAQMQNDERRTMNNAVAAVEGEKKFVWVLGANDRHCPSCAALAGQVRTMAEWEAAGETPGSAELLCGGNCHCALVEA